MDILQEVKLAYSDDERIRNLHYRAKESVSPEVAKKILKQAIRGGYNNFYAELLEKFPNDCKIVIAREYSVCLYVFRGSKSLPTKQDLQASEYDQKGDSMRIWWD